MAEAVGAFSPTNPDESELFTFDFVNDLRPGDSIDGTPEWAVLAVAGVDPNASNIPIGSPTVFGTTVTQRMAGWVSGVTYAISATVTTALGDTKTLWAYCPDEPIGC